MDAPDTSSSNSLRYFVVGVLCVAVLLGIYFVRLNAKVDQEREEAAERAVLCQQMERVASAAAARGLELRESCEQSSDQSSKDAVPY